MFRFSFTAITSAAIAIAAALTLNGCSQCSSPNQAPVPDAPAEVSAEAPAPSAEVPAEAPAAAPAEGSGTEATPAPASGGAH